MMFLMFTLIVSGCGGGMVTEPLEKVEVDQSQAAQSIQGKEFDLLLQASQAFLAEEEKTITAEEVYEKVVLEGDINYLVVDVRPAKSFADAHIEGSVNIPYALTAKPNMIANLPKDKTIVVACSSGHTAGQTAAFWSLLGYDAVPMLNGMGGWNKTAGSALKQFDYPVVTAEKPPIAAVNTFPTITAEGANDLQSLIIERAQSYLASGKGPIVKANDLKDKVLDGNDTGYFLVDIRQETDYSKGHIDGAINIPFQALADVESLKKIPTDKKVVLIGYTGIDASQVTRVLNQLGYDAYALFQGMRVWTTDEEVNGIAPASAEVITDLPVKVLQYNLDGGGGGTASCG